MNLKTRITALGGALALTAGLAGVLIAAPSPVFAATPTTSELAAEHPAMQQDLSYGDFSHWVCTLQADLALLGYSQVGPMDCAFGPMTQAAVEAFQSQNGLAVTGSTNEATWQDILAGFNLVPPYSQNSGSSSSNSNANAITNPNGSGMPSTIDGYPVEGELHMIATAYGPSLQDNYPYGPVDYFGQPLQFGMIAVDPSVIPLKTRLYVTGYTDSVLPSGGFLGQALDEGDAIQGDRIDIFMNQDPQTVSNFGIEPVIVYVLGN